MFRTPLYPFHERHGARFVDFAGWEMPILYTSIIAEHKHVRAAGGVFDVSHMGRLRIRGRGARRLLERALTRRVSDMQPGQCRYSLVCNEQGGVHDDVLVSRFEDDWLLVVNASNRRKIVDHLKPLAEQFKAEVEDQTLTTIMVAAQGPRVIELLSEYCEDIADIRRYRFIEMEVLLTRMIISRTGYTGEDGVEVILPANRTDDVVKMFESDDAVKDEHGEPIIRPAGLGARDTLRMEAGMPLYGHELGESLDPISAGLAFAVNLDKDQDANGEPFIGIQALQRIAAEGPKRKLTGLKFDGRRTPRQGATVKQGDTAIGEVTSGCLSPTLGHPIAMAYVDAAAADPGGAVQVELGAKTLDAQVVALPFYKR